MLEYPNGFVGSKWQRRGICGVLSVALCAGVSFEVAHAGCKRAMIDLKLGLRFRGGTYHKQRLRVLDRLAVRYEEVALTGRTTVGDFASYHAKPGVAYMLRIKGHVLTLKDGVACDQGHCGPVSSYKRRKTPLVGATAITGKGW